MKLIYSAILLSVGIGLAYWLKKRRFNRINQYGFEEFKNFGDKIFAGSVEKFLWWIALICIALGVIILAL
jgi:hypothetical protein